MYTETISKPETYSGTDAIQRTYRDLTLFALLIFLSNNSSEDKSSTDFSSWNQDT